MRQHNHPATMLMKNLSVPLMLAFTASNSAAYTAPKPPLSSVRVDAFSSRRSFLSNLAIASAASFGFGSNFAPANAADESVSESDALLHSLQ